MAFEVFTRKVQWGGSPSVAFTTNGRFSFNKAATAYFEKKSVQHVLLMWDFEKNLIGIKPIKEKEARSYKVHMGIKGNGCGFSAATFLRYIGYGAPETKSMPVKWDEKEGVFLIEVPKEFIKHRDVLS